MAVKDFMKPGYGKKQVVRIITVDIPGRQIEGVLKDGGQVRIAVWDTPVIFRWPNVAEVWTVRQDQGIWRLDALVEEYTDAALTESLSAGQARIAATEIKTADGGDVMVATNGVVDITQIHFPTAITAASAPNNTLFRDQADNKLKFKNNSGAVNSLY